MAVKPTNRNRQEQLAALQTASEDQGPVRARPANENDPALAMTLARLRRSPSYGIFYGAFGVSLAWIFGWSLVHSSEIFSPASGNAQTLPELMRAVAVLAVPILVFWAIAYFQWRAQQLRQTSEALLQSAMRLVRPQDIASENLSSIAKAVRHEVDLLVGGVEHAVQRASALEEIVHKEMSAVERAFGANEDRIRGLVSGLESQRVALQQTSQIVGGEAAPLLNRLETNTQNLGHVINLALDTFNRLESGLKHSSQELSQTIDDVSARATLAGNEIGAQSQHFERMSSMLIGDFSNFSGQLQGYVQSLNAAAGSLSEQSGRLGSEVKGMEASIIALLRQSADKLTAAHHEVGDTIHRFSTASAADIRGAAHEMQQTVTGIGESISYHLKATSGEIATLIERAGVETAHRIEESRTLLGGGMQDLAGDFVKKIALAQADLSGFVDHAAQQMNSNYNTAVNRLAERIDQSGAQMLAGLNNSGSGFLEQLNASGGDFAARIEQASATLSSNLNQNASGVVNSMSDAINGLYEKLNEVSGQATQGLAAAASQMQAAGNTINDVLVSTSGTIAAHLKETSGIVTRQMQDSGVALAQNIESSSGAVTDRMIAISGQFVDRLGEAQTGMLQLLENSASTMADDLQNTSSEVFSRLETSASHIGDQMEAIALRVTDSIDATAGNVATRVMEVTDKLSGQLDQSSDQLATLLDSTESRLAAQLKQSSGLFTNLFSTSTDAMSIRLNATAKEFGERLDHVATQFDRVQSAFSDGMNQTTAQITARFEQDTGLLVDRIDRATSELDDTSTASRKALDDAHSRFSGHVQTANSYFADQIRTAASELDEKLESVSMQLTGKLEVTGTRLSERLEDVTLLVDRSMDKFNNEIERMLISRRETLDALVSDASKRSQEVDSVMTSYMNMIEESLTAAETRSREISRIVAEQTQASLARLEDELKKLEGNSANQVSQAAKVLREQHERALSAMNEMLASTASDFQQTAQDMRITAQQVVRDIDSARNDLKRAVVDIPEETRNNADAMRKVVADQIAALSALSDAVRRQSGAIDFSGPGYIAPRGSGPGKSEGTPFSAPLSGTAGARQEDEERARSIEGAMAQIAASVEALSGDRRLAGRQDAQAVARSAAALPSHVAREIAGYSQKLSDAACEIVEAVEDGLPRDLEKRYRAGEAEIFLKRLHELRSKRFTATLAKRCGTEKILRSRINTYVRLFEKLLDTLGDIPGGKPAIDGVISSQNGQVYLMLAEAAGRLPDA